MSGWNWNRSWLSSACDWKTVRMFLIFLRIVGKNILMFVSTDYIAWTINSRTFANHTSSLLSLINFDIQESKTYFVPTFRDLFVCARMIKCLAKNLDSEISRVSNFSLKLVINFWHDSDFKVNRRDFLDWKLTNLHVVWFWMMQTIAMLNIAQ